jgi:response regulator RpfG family c-di-GMP phosphodiesterase
MKVLIVDDKEDARYLLQALLTGHGHEVSVATNGEEALERARAEPPDLIISDILMPVMDGFRLCREIRKDDALRDRLFVFYTATYTQESDADFAMKLGADDFIRKPTEPDAFLARIEAVLEKAEKGAAGREPELEEEAEVLRLYSDRLVAKLEKRSLDLQEELARRQEAEEALRRHAKRLETLREIDVAILEARSPESVAEIALEALQSILMSARASVTVFDLEAKQATVLAVRTSAELALTPGEVLPITAFGDVEELASGDPQQVADLTALSERTPEQDRLLSAGIKSYVLVPLRARDELIGSLNVGFSTPDETTDEAVQAAVEFANQLAIALQQAQLLQDVERHAEALERHVEELSKAKAELEASYLSLSRALSQTVEALAAAAEVRDPYTAGHQRRVTELAVAIAEALDLDETRIEGLRVAGLMHDIGKLAIPAELLSKPSRLTEAEYGLIRGHPDTARAILGTVEFPWPIPDIVIQHHERLDGSGYPNGLKGDEILLEARILAVADVVEAMSSHRPYRPALGIDEALAEIRDGAGVRFDASVVEACIELFESGEFQFSETD